MAKRKINKQFLTIAGLVILALPLLVLAAVLVRKKFFHEKPDKYIAAGKQDMADRKFADAAQQLGHAVSLSRSDPTLYVMLGDAFNAMAAKDSENLRKAKALWDQAIVVDPTSLPALTRVLGLFEDQVQVTTDKRGKAQVADEMKDAAEKLLAVDKTNLRAQADVQEAILERWQQGVPTDSSQVEDAIAKLKKLLPQAPQDPEIPFMIARCRIAQGQDVVRGGGGQEAAAADYHEAEQVMADAAAKAPDNAMMHCRLSEIYLALAGADRGYPTGRAAVAELKQMRQSYLAKISDEITKAYHLAKPQDPNYDEIIERAGRLALDLPALSDQLAGETPLSAIQTLNIPATLPSASTASATVETIPASATMPERLRTAELIYKDALNKKPDDPALRLALAEMLRDKPGRRDEAIKLLSVPIDEDAAPPGTMGTLVKRYEVEQMVQLLTVKLDSLPSIQDPAQAAKVIAECDDLYTQAAGRAGEIEPVVALHGRLLLAKHQTVPAIQAMTRALNMIDPQDQAAAPRRYDLMFLLARTDLEAGQTGDAKKLASDIVRAYGGFIPARLMLAQMLTGERNFTDAAPHLDFLEKQIPANPALAPQVYRMRIAALDRTKDADKIKAYYDKLPENQDPEIGAKVDLARYLNYNSEAERLLAVLLAHHPDEPGFALGLAQAYAADNTPEGHTKAIALLNDAITKHPNDKVLTLWRDKFSGASTQEITAEADGVREQQLANMKPLDRELAQFHIANDKGDEETAFKHLDAAEKIAPDDTRVWDLQFVRALGEHNWDRADSYLTRLVNSKADNADGLMYKVRSALAHRDMQSATSLAIQLTRDKPEFAQSWVMLGSVQQASGKDDDAISSFQQAIDRQTANPEALRGLVDCYVDEGNAQRAKEWIDTATRLLPNNAGFQEQALLWEQRYGDPAKVIAPREAAVAAHPELPRNWAALASAYVSVARSKANEKNPEAQQTYFTKAKDTLTQAMAKWPTDTQFAGNYAGVCLMSGDVAGGEKTVLALTSTDTMKNRPESALALADFYQAAGKPQQAEKALRDYMALVAAGTAQHGGADPQAAHDEDVRVQLRLAQLLANQSKTDDALAVLQQNAQDPAVLQQRVFLMINANRLAAADQELASAAAQKPLTPALLNLKAQIDLLSGRPQDAHKIFDQVIASQPDNVFALYRRAELSLGQHPPDLTSAISDLSHARDVDKADPTLRMSLAQALMRRNQPDDAIREMEDCVQVAPGAKAGWLYLLELYTHTTPPRWADADRIIKEMNGIGTMGQDPEVLVAQAVMWADRNDPDKALSLARDALTKAPNDLNMVHAYYTILLRAKDYQTLMDESTKLLAAHPTDPHLWWVYEARGQAERNMGDKDAAMGEFQKAMDNAIAMKNPVEEEEVIHTMTAELGIDSSIKLSAERAKTDDHWRIVAAGLYQQKGDNDAAQSCLEAALADFDKLTNEDQTQVLAMSAAAYLAKSPPDPLKAADMYRRILQRDPNDVSALNNLACLLDEKGPAYNPKEALVYSDRCFHQLADQGVDNPFVKDTEGWTMINNGRIDEGQNLIQEALAKQDFPDAHYHLAEAYLQRQPAQPDDAVSELNKAQHLLEAAEQKGQPVDETLRTKVQADLKRAKAAKAS